MQPSRRVRHITFFALALLMTEFLDELVYGAGEAAWPLIRDDLALSYTQIGILIAVPGLFSSIVEPILGILADRWRRRMLILGGGALLAAALALTAVSRSFAPLLLSFMLFYPASGAFVSLSQATLMDVDPERREPNMARWTLAGSLGVVTGSLLLGAAAALGLGWRPIYAAFAVLTVIPLLLLARFPSRRFSNTETPKRVSLKLVWAGFADAFRALRRPEVRRWMTLLWASDLMLDVLLGFLALYFVDVVRTSQATASLAVTIWTVFGLLGNLLFIPLLERVESLRYLRWSAVAVLALYGTLLLVPTHWAKLILLGALGFCNAGWYSVLQAQVYATMPGHSGIALTVGNLFGLVAGLIPLALGLIAENFSLIAAMALLLLGPLTLLAGLPRTGRAEPHALSPGE